MEWVDFAASGWLPAEAGWFLDWSPEEPEAPALGGVRLYLNNGHVAIREALGTATPDERHDAIRQSILYDVACSLVIRCLEGDAFGQGWSSFPADSLGAAVQRLIETLLGSESLEVLQREARSDRDRLRCKLQASLRLFGTSRLP